VKATFVFVVSVPLAATIEALPTYARS
jgi:hypothetical protein